MQFFSLDGFDLQSNVLLVFHMCECMDALDECMCINMPQSVSMC